MTQDVIKNERLQQLEQILGTSLHSRNETRYASGLIEYEFPAGILYENIQLLLTCISKGLDYNISFTKTAYKVTSDGILQTPHTIVVNGQHITSDSITVSWVDHEWVQKQRIQEIKDFYNV